MEKRWRKYSDFVVKGPKTTVIFMPYIILKSKNRCSICELLSLIHESNRHRSFLFKNDLVSLIAFFNLI